MFKPLNVENHKSLKINQVNNYDFAKHRGVIQIGLDEVSSLSKELPVVFGSADSPGIFVLDSLQANENWMLDNGQWAGELLPKSLTIYPFGLESISKEKNAYRILIDEQAPHISKTRGKTLYRKNGTPSKRLEEIKVELEKMHRSVMDGVDFAKQLESLGLLKPKTLEVNQGGSMLCRVKGFQVVDVKALNALPQATLNHWKQSGVLALIQAHLKSQLQVANLFVKKYRAA